MPEDEPERIEGQDIIMVFIKDGKFLLSQRSQNNKSLPNECIFPSEKSFEGEDAEEALMRGAREEMDTAPFIYEEVFTGLMAHLLNKDPRKFRAFIIYNSNGEIKNLEPEKEKLFWVEKEKVMQTLTINESKDIFIFVLMKLGIFTAEDLEFAPEMILPKVETSTDFV